MKLWEGMLSGKIDQLAEVYNNSIKVDWQLLEEDIIASLAHVKMLEQTKILTENEAQTIKLALEELLKEYQAGTLKIDFTAEDVHTFVEASLKERIGKVAGKLHTARSRNDQVVTDLRLKVAKEVKILCREISELLETLATLAADHQFTIMPGLTHLQAAQAISLAQHVLAWAFALKRDYERLKDSLKRIQLNPLGACALAGTTFPIDRQLTTQELGFIKPLENSLDAVSARDFVLEVLSDLSILHSNYSRIAEELVLWSSSQFGYIKLAADFTTGSSIMPQKINPDIAELIRGKTGSVYGALVQALTMVKALPLAYSKDLQEDKKMLFEALEACHLATVLLKRMIASMTVYPENLLKATEAGYLQATDLADYLAKKGVPFREAHHQVARLVHYAIAKSCTLPALSLAEYQQFNPLFEEDVYNAIDLKKMVEERYSLGGTASVSTSRQIKELLANLEANLEVEEQ